MVSKTYVQLPGTERPAPELASRPEGLATRIQEVKASTPIEVSVYLKGADDDSLLAMKPTANGATALPPDGQATSRAMLREKRTTDLAGSIAKVVAFANEMGLTVVKTEPARRLIKIAGPADKLEAAFRTKLHDYNDGKTAFRARTGALSVPDDVAPAIEAVLGLDTRPQARPRLVSHAVPHIVGGHLPNEVGKLYSFPSTPGHGKGQCIAIIELGGGFRRSDNATAFAAMGLSVPKVMAISVSGGLNQPGVDPGADGEVALDIQVAGGVAPGSTLAVYFAPNTTQGFVDAITRAVHDDLHRPSVISISWGSSESNWTGQALNAMNAAIRDAVQLGVTVFAASGDNLATDGVQDQRAHVDFPASCPYAVGCGGTVVDAAAGQISDERVWNNIDSGTGGGISDTYPVPGYQANTEIPKSVNDGKVRRGVPDVSADADPNSGYRIVVAGASSLIGGTSAAAPLWAGLFALINEAAGKAAGFAHPLLYGNPSAFRDIKAGNNMSGNIGYDAGAGWDACTGLGSPNGAALLGVFQKANASAAVAAAHGPRHVRRPSTLS